MNLFTQLILEFVNQRAALPGDEGYGNPNFYSIKPDGKLQYYPKGPSSRSKQVNLSQQGHRQASAGDVKAWESWFNPNTERPQGVRTWNDYQEYLQGSIGAPAAGGDNPLSGGPSGAGPEGPPTDAVGPGTGIAGEPGMPSSGDQPGVPLPPAPNPRTVKLDKSVSKNFNSSNFKTFQDMTRAPDASKSWRPVDNLLTTNISSFTETIPKYYSSVITNLLNTHKSSRVVITDFIEVAGQGILSSTFAELLSILFLNISNDSKADKLYSELLSHVESNNKNLLIDKSWIESSYFHRKAFIAMMDDRYGVGSWKVEGIAWDIPDEVEMLGLPYSEKGFSTDLFVRVRIIDGRSEVVELSLKKDKNITLLNSTTSKIREILFVQRAPTHVQEERNDLLEERRRIAGRSSIKAIKRKKEIDSRVDEMELSYTSDIPEMVDDRRAKLIQQKIHENAIKHYSDQLKSIALSLVRRDPSLIEQIDSKMGAGGKIIKSINNGKYDKVLQSFIKHHGPMTWDHLLQYSKDGGITGSGRAVQKLGMILAAGAFISNETGPESKYFLSLRINAYKHTEQVRNYIFQEPDAKEGLLKVLGADFPLKNIMSGDEVMLIGRYAFDDKIATSIFGTSDFAELEENLKPRNEPPPPSIVYEVEGREPIPIAIIDVRPDGIGYGQYWKFDARLHPDFFNEIREANKKRGRLQENYLSHIVDMYLQG